MGFFAIDFDFLEYWERDFEFVCVAPDIARIGVFLIIELATREGENLDYLAVVIDYLPRDR